MTQLRYNQYMTINGGLLIMVSEDNTQARTTSASSTDTPETLYQYNQWANYTKVDTKYLVRAKKCW
jgi:hypothetical protein